MEIKTMVSYTTIIHDFRKQYDLSMNDYVLADILDFLSSSRKYGQGTYVKISRDEIAKELGVSKSGLRYMIDRLIEKDLAEKEPSTGKLRATEKWQEVRVLNSKSMVQKVHHNKSGMVQKVHQNGAKSAPKSEVTPYSIRIKDIYIVCDSKEKVFEEFMKLYGKTNDKSRAKRKFLTLKQDVYQDIFDAVPHYVNSTPDKQYRKNALTWLNGECWNDIDIPSGLFTQPKNEQLKVEPLPNNEW